MSVEEFWWEDPDLFWAYRFSYHNKTKSQQELSNTNAWLQGMYFYEALSVALNNSFSKQKLSYTKKPYSFNEKEEKKTNNLDLKLKVRAIQIKSMLGGGKNGSRK